MSGLTPVRVRRRQPEGDASTCRFLGSEYDSPPIATTKATGVPSRSQYPICKPCRDPYKTLSRSAWHMSPPLQPYVAFTGILDLYSFLALFIHRYRRSTVLEFL
ncbi:hypothetical protein Taro_001886 [Colocasia esculenta]|uniref:Uncharacterized protein n=1 Tax=Colocasia esculenta TaxID=4460 RepID=A0A843TJ98_COLES|nr:hypothetical protein [Colocasia esculenta]